MAKVTFPNGNQYSDDDDPSTGLLNGGHRMRFIQSLIDFISYGASIDAGSVPPLIIDASLTGWGYPPPVATVPTLGDLPDPTVPGDIHLWWAVTDIGDASEGCYISDGAKWLQVLNISHAKMQLPVYMIPEGTKKVFVYDFSGSNLGADAVVMLPPSESTSFTRNDKLRIETGDNCNCIVCANSAGGYERHGGGNTYPLAAAPMVDGTHPQYTIMNDMYSLEYIIRRNQDGSSSSWGVDLNLETILTRSNSNSDGWGNDAEQDSLGYFRRFSLSESQYKKIERPIEVTRNELLDLTGGPYLQTIIGFVDHIPTVHDSIVVNDAYGFNINDNVYIYDCADNDNWYTISLIEDAISFGFPGKFVISFIGANMINYGDVGMVKKAAVPGRLIPGAYYKISDFCTDHVIPKTADRNTGINEPLTVQALTESLLSPIATSEQYPRDMIYYEIQKSGRNPNNDHPYGRISRRIDTTPNAYIDFPEDWRNTRYRRWTTGTTINPILCSPPTSPNDFIMHPTQTLSATVTRIYIEITAAGEFSWKEAATDLSWAVPNIVIDGEWIVAINNFTFKFVSSDHPIGTSWSMYIEGNYDQIESSGSSIGSIDIRPVQTRRQSEGLCDIIVGSNAGDLSNIVIAHDFFPWEYIPANEFAIGTHANINIGPDCKELTLCRGVGTFWLRGSYGGLIVKPNCHHIDIGMCGDGTYLGYNCSSINLGNNCSSINIGNECNGVNVEDGVDQLIIPSKTVGRSYGTMTKPYTIDGVDTGCGNPPVTNSYTNQIDLDAAMPLPAGTWYTRADYLPYTFLWDGFTHIQVPNETLALEPYRFGANYERHLMVMGNDAFVRLPHANNPADAEFIATLKHGDKITITTLSDIWVCFRNARGNYRSHAPMWNAVDGDNYHGYRIGDKLDLEMVWDGVNNRFNPVGAFALTFRDSSASDGLSCISVGRNSDGNFVHYPLSQSQYFGMMNVNEPVDLGAKMVAVQQVGSSTVGDKVLLANEVDGQAYSSTVQNILDGAMNYIANNVRGARRPFFIENDFIAGTAAAGTFPFTPAAIGSGTIANIVPGNSELIGTVQLRSSTTNPSGYSLLTNGSSQLLDGDEAFEIVFRIPAGSASTSQRFGFMNTAVSAVPSNAVYFSVANSTLNANVTVNGSNTQVAIGTISVNNTTWYRAKITIKSPTETDFELFDVNGNLVFTKTTMTATIPQITTREVGCGCIGLNAGTSVTNLLDVCYMSMLNGVNGMNR